jgi:hypothetical protein
MVLASSISEAKTLLLKHLDKFYNRKEIPWVKLVWHAHYSNGDIPHTTINKRFFWWKDVFKLCDLFRGIVNCKIGNGSTVLFWLDLWNDNVMQNNSLDFSPLPKTRRFLCCSFFQTTTLSHNFTSHCLNKLTKNTKQCKTIFKLYRFNGTQNISGTIFGATVAILLLNSTTSPTEIFSLLPLSYGFKIQSAVTNLKSSPGSWLWIV